MAGKRQNNDVRNQLMHSYIEIVRLVQPKFLFFENVQGLPLILRVKTPQRITLIFCWKS